MLIEKDLIGPGTIWYVNPKTGTPRRRIITSADISRWAEQGNKMIAAGLDVPIPKEHNIEADGKSSAHPMTPADKLTNNTGYVKEYRVAEDKLFAVLDIKDQAIADKLGTTIKWTSPGFSSFVDGKGNKWSDVVSHVALTLRPRVADQAPFKTLAEAMTFAISAPEDATKPLEDYSLSLAGKLRHVEDRFEPEFPIAFSLYGGITLSEEDAENEKPKEKPKEKHFLDDDKSGGDMKMDELLRDLLNVLGIKVPQTTNDTEFRRALYEAAMHKIKESAAKPPAPMPGASLPKKPVVQEQHPMYMSLEEINKLEDADKKAMALAFYNENVKLTARLDASDKAVANLRDAKLKEETAKRGVRINTLATKSPKVKADLDSMIAKPEMALSIGDGGDVIDPMEFTLSVLEKGLSDVPSLLKIATAQEQPHPTDGEMTEADAEALADGMARNIGCAPKTKAG